MPEDSFSMPKGLFNSGTQESATGIVLKQKPIGKESQAKGSKSEDIRMVPLPEYTLTKGQEIEFKKGS